MTQSRTRSTSRTPPSPSPNGDGDGEGTHVSVYTLILEGKHDARLIKWPFIGEVNLTLLNQLEDESHHIKTVTLY